MQIPRYLKHKGERTMIKYNFSVDVRDNGGLRASFNELTQKVFGFDFSDWYEKGHWGDQYIPHVLIDNHGKIISNVSVNLMKFDIGGTIRNYIQLGTVMTDPDYRGQGFNKFILRRVLEEYQGKVDGIYLFGNDSVRGYYPKFGFKPMKEYEYSINLNKGIQDKEQINKYQLKKVDLSDQNACEKLYHVIQTYEDLNLGRNPNDGFCMCNNPGLYQFWLAAEFSENVYYLSDLEAYVIANVQSGILTIYQIISIKRIDMETLAHSFEKDVTDVRLCFTPINKEAYNVNLHKKEDCTLFILGEDLEKREMEKMIFPAISHA